VRLELHRSFHHGHRIIVLSLKEVKRAEVRKTGGGGFDGDRLGQHGFRFIESAEKVIAPAQAAIKGWTPSPVSMGDYSDFNMNAPKSGQPTAGICHARGANADLPAQWLMYVVVEDIGKSRARCEELGGKLLTPIKDMGGEGRYCVIQDPAGAVAALWEKTT
jgi:predicted enzyme related to lactoylglutathione lyase